MSPTSDACFGVLDLPQLSAAGRGQLDVGNRRFESLCRLTKQVPLEPLRLGFRVGDDQDLVDGESAKRILGGGQWVRVANHA
jgi:hypothetical protein